MKPRTLTTATSTLLMLSILGLAACDSEPATPEELAARGSDFGPRLDVAPYAIDIDASALAGAWVQTLDLHELDPERSHVVFLQSPNADDTLVARDPESGELLGEGEVVQVLYTDLGKLHVSRIELAEGTKLAELVGQLQPSARPHRMLFCDEVVTEHADAVPGSLRDVVARVRAGGSVCFDPQAFAIDTEAEVIGHIEITDDIHIHGLPTRPVLRSDGGDRILTFGPGSDASIDDLVLADGGHVDGGGLLRSSGRLRAERVGFLGGSALEGGAIYSDGQLWLTDCQVDDSFAVDGGGIFSSYGEVTLVGTAVRGNEGAHRGGGVFGHNARFLMRGGTAISGNHAVDAGGGMYLRATAFVGDNTLWNASLTANVSDGDGGAVFLEDARLVISSNPTAPLQDVIHGNRAARGGGVALDDGAYFELAGDTRVVDNAAISGGGVFSSGTVELGGSAKLLDNYAAQDGGGALIAGGTLRASSAATIEGNTAVRLGGGVRLDGGLYTGLPAAVLGNVPTDIE